MDYIGVAVNELNEKKNENNAVRVKFYGTNPESGEDEYMILPMEGMPKHLGNLFSFIEVSMAAMRTPTNMFFS